MSLFSKFFDSNEKQVKKLEAIVAKINSYEAEFEKLSDEQIPQKTEEWKNALKSLSDEEQNKYIEKLLPEAFALVREASKRSLGMRQYDVQLIGGIVLHQGKIAEQKTGEGKTLTAAAPLYLNALTGRGVHLVTPNDYLSRHGAGWMGRLYNFLGMSVGVIIEDVAFTYDPNHENLSFNDEYAVHLKPASRKEAYKSDIVYGTNHHFGFDYLRDNMARNPEGIVQTNPRGDFGFHNFAIIDEVDFILIDVARTPLIISSASAQASDRYIQAASIVRSLIKDSDFEVEEKFKSATLTDLGIRRVENMLKVGNLYEEDYEMVHLIEQSLIARALYERDRDYVVKDGEVVIVDQNTGRLLPTNRYSRGLHQAIEAKEGVAIKEESKTIAEVSYQNYFKRYSKLSGMTGTAATEAEEFFKIYSLEVIAIPTHRDVSRKDLNDVVYKTEAAKFRAVADEISERHKNGQPVLVGTTSVEKSQLLHELLRRRKVQHEILNAKNHEQEALIIAQAGKKNSVTVSTNMAGRGVDIILGGDPFDHAAYEEVKAAGGLHVIGTERHESRRIDNQLRGRSGRQGDPGSSKFYVSLQDPLMKIFGGSQVERVMEKFGLEENVPLEAGIVSRSIESAQKKVEGFNFDRRKQVVEMDDVINVHREVVYKLRRKLLFANDNPEEFENWFLNKLQSNSDFDVENKWDAPYERFKSDWFKVISEICLPVIDMLWSEHLSEMDQLREGIGLRGYAQRDPKVEYKREGHARFEVLVARMYSMMADRLTNVNIELAERPAPQRVKKQDLNFITGEAELGVSEEASVVSKPNRRGNSGIQVSRVVSNKEKVGRNDLCPCGSGLKYKNCGLINAKEHKG